MPPCLFCDSPADSLEHAWPGWISGLFYRNPRTGQYRIERYSTLTGNEVQSWHTPSIDMTVRVVCQTCNNEWMSRLEGHAQPVLTPLIQDARTRRTLSLDDQAAIVMWCAKMGIVFEHTAPGEAGKFYTRDEHLAFAETLVPPDVVYIWIAQSRSRRGRRAHSTVQNLLLGEGERNLVGN